MSAPLYAILEIAQGILYAPPTDNNRPFFDEDPRVERMARYIIDTLGPLLECGYESPVVNHNYNPLRIDIPEYIGVPVEDARTIATAILRACDEAQDG